MRLRWLTVLLGALAFAPPLVAQAGRPPVGPIARAMAAERRGDFVEAADAYAEVLRARATDGQAILGLARVLPPLERRVEMVGHLERALAVDSLNMGLLALAVRTHALLGDRDAARAAVERWAAVLPGDEEPYREWAMAALEIADRGAAKAALELGRNRIAHPAALAPELAQLRQSEGDFAGATAEWLRAIDHAPGFRASAVLLLSDAPEPARSAIAGALRGAGSDEARRVHGVLLAHWGQPNEGATLLLGALPTDPGSAMPLLRSFLEELRGRTDRDAHRARGRALEALAVHQEPDAALRTRMDAARAFADGADESEARRLLAQIAADPRAVGGVATAASTTLLGVLIAEGRPREADSLFAQLQGGMSFDDQERERRRIAMAWARAGDLARAERLMEPDSTVTGFDIRGRLRAFAGDLATATAMLRIAGPWDDAREVSVARVQLLALMQAVATDSLPAFGAALLQLERGDTSAAVAEFEQVAGGLEPPGAAALRLLAGELAAAQGEAAVARRLLLAADIPEAPAAAPAARFALAALHADAGRRVEAEALLERLILDFPDSAVVPEARRARDLLRRTPAGAT